jgi:thioredoxin 1
VDACLDRLGAVRTSLLVKLAEALARQPEPCRVPDPSTDGPPCHMIAPVLAEIASERTDSLTVRRINTDENPVFARNYQVMSLPTLMHFRDGQPVQALVGARPKARLLAELDAALWQ